MCYFAHWVIWPNTLHAHRLMHLSKSVSNGIAHKLKLSLFEHCYEKGGNISKIDELIEIGKQYDLPDVENYMHDASLGFEEVIIADRIAKKSGITGVPDFTIICEDFKTTMHGAQV